MKCGVRIALGMAGGYLLGRNRKGRMLLLLGAAVASRNVAGMAARRGTASLTSSPEVSRLVEQGREAAVALLSSRIESLTDQLHSRTEALRHPDGAEQAVGDDEAEESHDEAEEDEEEEEYDEDAGPQAAEEGSGEESESEPEPEPEAEAEAERRERRRPQGRPARDRATAPRGRSTAAGRRGTASQARR